MMRISYASSSRGVWSPAPPFERSSSAVLLADLVIPHAGIDRGGVACRVPEHLLQAELITATQKEVRSEGMATAVRAEWRDAGLQAAAPEHELRRGLGHPVAAIRRMPGRE